MAPTTPGTNRVKSPTNKILLVIPFWSGDKQQAMELAKLLADLEPHHSNRADVLFVSRFDCVHDFAAEKRVSRKFNTFSYTSKRRGTGWPMGCNALFFGAMEWAYHKINAGQVPHYKGILILAGDGGPLRADWLTPFYEEANSEGKKYVAGTLIEHPDHPHINGDCILLSTDIHFLKYFAVTVGDISTSVGWDWALASEFQSWGWKNLPYVRSHWNKREDFSDADWDRASQDGITWFHGQKGFSLIAQARRRLVK